jgi:hypothetical protein
MFILALAFGFILWFAQYYAFDAIRKHLSAYHPSALIEISASSWPNKLAPFSAAMSDYVWGKKYEAIGDPRLSELGRKAALISWLVVADIVFAFVGFVMLSSGHDIVLDYFASRG